MGTLTITNPVRPETMDKNMKFVRFCSNLDFVLRRHSVNINDVDLVHDIYFLLFNLNYCDIFIFEFDMYILCVDLFSHPSHKTLLCGVFQSKEYCS